MQVLIDNGKGFTDYTRYVVDGSLSTEDSINVPTLTNFILAPSDNTFVVPRRSAYVKVVSERYAFGGGFGTGKILATGFVSNEPERQYLGLSPVLTTFGNQQLSYKINVTSDEWLLNSRVVPYIPAFVNQTMGQILASIAQVLAPGFFDTTSFVGSGDIVPYYQYNSSSTWSDIAKDFGDSVRYRYKVRNRIIYFQPFGDQPLGISYDEATQALGKKNFPLELDTGVLTVPPVNDAIVMGDIEPQTNVENYFIGDGFTSQFRLRHKVFDGSTALLLQDDWTETDFQTNLWNIVVNGTADETGGSAFDLIGSLAVNMGTSNVALGQTYILGTNGIELGGGLNLQHGEFEFTDRCEGIVGGIYSSTNLVQSNCIAGFNLTTSGSVFNASASGAAGIIIQPMYKGQLVGPQVVSQTNHHYVLQTWVGAQKWDRYERVYRNLVGDVTYGGNQLSASGTITWVITDLDEGAYSAPVPVDQSIVQFQKSIVPSVTKFTLQDQNLPQFCVYSPINAKSLNLSLWYTLLAQPPEGSLYVRSLTGATGLQLPVLPPQLWTPNTLPQNKLGTEIHYLMGFGQQNQTATIIAQGDSNYLAFYEDSIPGVGARIRHQSWAAQQSMSRVVDPIAIANEACISGDSGVRSAIFTSLNPLPRTSSECELAAGAAILDNEYPQFQGTYTVETIPYRYETLFNPGIYDYPKSGEKFYINSSVRAITGQNFVVNTARVSVIELRDEVLQLSVDYGPDLYLEKMLANFEQRTDKLLRPQEVSPPIDFVHLAQVGNAFLPTLDSARIINIQNSNITGNSVTVDLGQIPNGWVCEVRRVDSGWGSLDSNEMGRFSSQVFTLPRTSRDQTFYLRELNTNTGLFSRFSKALRVDYPFIPSPPVITTLTSQNLVLGFNGWTSDIYGVELRLPGISGTYVINFPVTQNGPTQITNQTGPAQSINQLVRSPLTDDITNFNTKALVPQVLNGQTFQFQVGDIVLVNSSTNSSFNGLKVLSSVGNTSGQFPTLVANQYGNYVDTWFWSNPGGGHFNTAGTAFPFNTASALAHDVGNSLAFNPAAMGFGVDPNRQPMQKLTWPITDLINGATFSNWGAPAGFGQFYEAAVVFRLQVPAAGNYIISFACDDGYFYGIDGGATQVSGPNTTFHATTAVASLPVLGGIDADGAHFNIPTVHFPAAGVYNCEIDYYQSVNEQMLEITNGTGATTFPLLPGFLEQITWFDLGQSFPTTVGSNNMRFTNVGSVSLQARNSHTFVASGSVTNGLATIRTQTAHSLNPGDVVCVGARITPLTAANGSLDASAFTGQWTITSVTSTSFSFTAGGTLPQNQPLVQLIGVASQFIVNPNPTVAPASGQIVTLNAVGTLIQKPVFAPSDLQFDLTDPAISDVIDVAQILNPSGFQINAYFFNLMWDYSDPLVLSKVAVPVISGLTVDPVTQQAAWQIMNGTPTGYRVSIQDPVTQQTYNTFTVDHPHNKQPLTQFKLLPSDYNNVRTITVTPFNALGDGPPIATLHNAVSATGIANPEVYHVAATINGLIGSEQILVRVPFAYAISYAQNMVPSQAWIDVPPVSGNMICSLQKFTLGVSSGTIGTEFGCLNFTPNSHVGTWNVPGGETFNVGECLKVIAPTASGNNGVGIGLDIAGTLVFNQNNQAITTTSSSPGTGIGTVVDMLDWILMPSPQRTTSHLTGNAVKYFAKDTDASQSSVASTHGISRIYLIKSSGGNPADIWRYDSSFIYDELTEDGDDADQATCVANGFPGGCFLDPQAYKRLGTPFKAFPRFFTLGSRIQLDTPGPNTITRTTNCESTSTAVTLGPVSEITYGPIVVKDWGGAVGAAQTIIREHYYGMTGGVFQDKEVYYMAQGFGQFAWEHYTMVGGSYHLQQSSVNNTVTAGGAPTLAFACVPGPTWW